MTPTLRDEPERIDTDDNLTDVAVIGSPGAAWLHRADGEYVAARRYRPPDADGDDWEWAWSAARFGAAGGVVCETRPAGDRASAVEAAVEMARELNRPLLDGVETSI